MGWLMCRAGGAVDLPKQGLHLGLALDSDGLHPGLAAPFLAPFAQQVFFAHCEVDDHPLGIE
jgi:hypothetical protein